jgi:hypothetical protein
MPGVVLVPIASPIPFWTRGSMPFQKNVQDTAKMVAAEYNKEEEKLVIAVNAYL